MSNDNLYLRLAEKYFQHAGDRPYTDSGESVAAVVAQDGGRNLLENSVVELPRNTVGKVQKAQLRETYRGNFQ